MKKFDPRHLPLLFNSRFRRHLADAARGMDHSLVGVWHHTSITACCSDAVYERHYPAGEVILHNCGPTAIFVQKQIRMVRE